MPTEDMMTLSELEFLDNRRRGYYLAQRHGAVRTMRAILRRSFCFEEIFDAALREVGERRLIEILSRPRHEHWLGELVLDYWERLSRESKIRALLCLSVEDAVGVLRREQVSRPVRKAFFKKISRKLADRSYASAFRSMFIPHLSEKERALLGIW